ncbi:unnamed protein product [Heterobilharzia americana]|nr:unnamed protein product [Heterobilharzia americana]
MNEENLTYVTFLPLYGTWHIYLTVIILGTIIICTVIGNMFVVVAILIDRHLQRVSNYLILSLAIADLMVATLVMPVSALNEVSEKWWLGVPLCDIWTVMDVLCCTASILHLVAIAMDRYWAITRVDYVRGQNKRPIYIMIIIVWILSLAISLPTRFHTSRNPSLYNDVLYTGECSINKEYVFTIFSTVVAFYMPMAFLIAIYAKIYRAARERIRKKRFQSTSTTITPSNKTPLTILSKRSKFFHKKINKSFNNNFTKQYKINDYKISKNRCITCSTCVKIHLFNCPMKIDIENSRSPSSNEVGSIFSENDTSSPYFSEYTTEYSDKYYITTQYNPISQQNNMKICNKNQNITKINDISKNNHSVKCFNISMNNDFIMHKMNNRIIFNKIIYVIIQNYHQLTMI